MSGSRNHSPTSTEQARSLGQRLILPPLLVWVSTMQLGRSDIEVADKLKKEAWVCPAMHTDTRYDGRVPTCVEGTDMESPAEDR